MTQQAKRFSRRYAAALRGVVGHPRDPHLPYELGRRALDAGLGLQDLVRVHQTCLRKLLAAEAPAPSRLRLLGAAQTFFMEALGPFEVTHRGFRDTHLKMSELNETLAKRNLQLATANLELKREIGQRKLTEQALRESGEHYRVLFNEARAMQENLRQLSHQVLFVQEQERKRISRELHDEVGQALTAVNMHLTMLRNAAVLDTKAGRRQLAAMQLLLRQTMDTVHHFARELRPAMLDDLGLAPALRSYASGFADRTGIRVHCQISGAAERLGPEEKLALYRVAQESLTNIAKHAHARDVRLTIAETPRDIRMEIADNGQAFVLKQNLSLDGKKRLGLLGMQERIRLIHGQFSITSSPGQGTTVRVLLPRPLPPKPQPRSPKPKG